MADSKRDKARAALLATKPTKSAFDVDKEQQARQKARDTRDASVNNERTRETGLFTSKGAQPVDDVVEEAQTGKKKNRGR